MARPNTLHDLLGRHSLDPKNGWVLCHRGRRYQTRLFEDAMGGDPRFSAFQEIQGSKTALRAFRTATYLVCFVAPPGVKDIGIFVGVWRRTGAELPIPLPAQDEYEQPLDGQPIRFPTERDPRYDEYRGRFSALWTDPWIQRTILDRPLSFHEDVYRLASSAK